jgi:hypothetical protein
MRVENVARHLRVLLRADAIIADIQFRSRASQAAYGSAAMLVALFGLVMFGIAGFFALRVIWGPAWAAACIGAIFVVIALILSLIGNAKKPGRELDLAMDVHKAALDALVNEAKSAGDDFSSTASFMKHPLDSALPSLVVPLASILLKTLRKSGKSASSS